MPLAQEKPCATFWSTVYWDVAWCWLVVCYQGFKTMYWSHLQGTITPRRMSYKVDV